MRGPPGMDFTGVDYKLDMVTWTVSKPAAENPPTSGQWEPKLPAHFDKLPFQMASPDVSPTQVLHGLQQWKGEWPKLAVHVERPPAAAPIVHDLKASGQRVGE